MNRVSFFLISFLAIAIGLYPSIYFLIDRKFGLLQSKSETLLSDPYWNAGFYIHIILSGIALLIGWIQFNKKLRTRKPILHRNIGKLYVVTALIGAVTGVYISFYATGGLIAATGFAMLGIIWFSTTLKAYKDARNASYEAHRKMMIFSYAACFAAVTLRLYLSILGPMLGFIPAYQIVSWLCWVPNMFVAYLLTKDPKRYYSSDAQLMPEQST